MSLVLLAPAHVANRITSTSSHSLPISLINFNAQLASPGSRAIKTPPRQPALPYQGTQSTTLQLMHWLHGIVWNVVSFPANRTTPRRDEIFDLYQRSAPPRPFQLNVTLSHKWIPSPFPHATSLCLERRTLVNGESPPFQLALPLPFIKSPGPTHEVRL